MAYLLVIFTASVFSRGLFYVEAWRRQEPAWMFAMPLLMLFVLWDRARARDVLSTREEVRFLRETSIPREIRDGEAPERPVRMAAGIKLTLFTWIAHLFGASVGREAVGVQLGGWAARMRGVRGWYFAACLAAGFAIVMGAPFAATAFVFESKGGPLKSGALNWRGGAGVLILAWLAYRASLLLGVTHPEYYQFATTLTELQTISFEKLFFFSTALILTGVGLSFLFLYLVSRVGPRARRRVVLPFLFFCAVAGFFYWLGPKVEMNGLAGLGISILPQLATTEPSLVDVLSQPFLFAVIKVFLTALFVALGVRGGELTPLLVAGAMVSVGLGVWLHLPVAGLVALGFPVLWGIAARRPLTAAILATELFGFAPWGLLGILAFIFVFVGIKLGDLVDRRLNKNVRPNFWRRGLYDEDVSSN